MITGEISILTAGVCFISVVLLYCVIVVAHSRRDLRDIKSKGRGK